MKNHTTQPDSATLAAKMDPQLFDDWFDPIEFGVRNRVRDFIETMMEEELEAVLSRPRYGRIAPTANKEAGTADGVTGHRHGHRSGSLLGTFGPIEVAMPRARLNARVCRSRYSWMLFKVTAAKVLLPKQKPPRLGGGFVHRIGRGEEVSATTRPNSAIVKWTSASRMNGAGHDDRGSQEHQSYEHVGLHI